MKILITESAYNDIASAKAFYGAQERGLGEYFQDSIFSDIDSLLVNAGIHTIHYGKHRLLSKKFPYAIYYQKENDTIVVYAVLDCRRNPKGIKDKLRREISPSGGVSTAERTSMTNRSE